MYLQPATSSPILQLSAFKAACMILCSCAYIAALRASRICSVSLFPRQHQQQACFHLDLVDMQICSYHFGSNRMIGLPELLESLHSNVPAHLAFVQGLVQGAQELHAPLLFQELHCQGQHCIVLCTTPDVTTSCHCQYILTPLRQTVGSCMVMTK